MLRAAIDIGGTFTDVVLEDGISRHSAKVLTTHDAPERGALEGLTGLLRDARRGPAELAMVLHGTTLATNALIERKGARTAMLVTRGFRDCLEMGYEKRYAQYDLRAHLPRPLVSRPLRFEAVERITASGSVDTPLDPESVRIAARQMARAGVEAVAIGFLHAYAYPDHEIGAAEILASELPNVTICRSSEVCPEMREYERFSTTVANAYIRPLMQGYLDRLQTGLNAMDVSASVFMMLSGGGLTTLDQAARLPIRLVESGPAGGAILAADIAHAHGLDAVMAYDMGGTTAKICLIEKGEPDRARLFEIAREYRDMRGSGLPVRIPVIEMVEIGAGGGSIARVDALGQITVGPDSAGSDPGPASYGRGGSAPTVTDANLSLGRIDAEGFAGGRIPLDAAAADRALQDAVGKPLGLGQHWPAAGVVEIIDETMSNAARVHAIERGKEPAEYTMIAFGGGAPLHAVRLAAKLGLTRVLVPLGAGVGSAIGFLRAPVSYEVVRSLRSELRPVDLPVLDRLLAEMAADAKAVVRKGAGGSKIRLGASVDLRYRGQGHELTIPLARPGLSSEDPDRLRNAYEAQYESIYGLNMPFAVIESVSWSVKASTPPSSSPPAHEPDAWQELTGTVTRPAYDSACGKILAHKIFRRDELRMGDEIHGPAIVTEEETSTILPDGWRCRVLDGGALMLEQGAGPAGG